MNVKFSVSKSFVQSKVAIDNKVDLTNYRALADRRRNFNQSQSSRQSTARHLASKSGQWERSRQSTIVTRRNFNQSQSSRRSLLFWILSKWPFWKKPNNNDWRELCDWLACRSSIGESSVIGWKFAAGAAWRSSIGESSVIGQSTLLSMATLG